jgi:hypothetical protein
LRPRQPEEEETPRRLRCAVLLHDSITPRPGGAATQCVLLFFFDCYVAGLPGDVSDMRTNFIIDGEGS